MTSLAELRRALLTDAELKAEYERQGSILALLREMIEAGPIQAEVAAVMETTQSVVARLENSR